MRNIVHHPHTPSLTFWNSRSNKVCFPVSLSIFRFEFQSKLFSCFCCFCIKFDFLTWNLVVFRCGRWSRVRILVLSFVFVGCGDRKEMATMESLIGLVNRIQRACTALGDYGGDDDKAFSSLWDTLPSVAVVGGQVSISLLTGVIVMFSNHDRLS